MFRRLIATLTALVVSAGILVGLAGSASAATPVAAPAVTAPVTGTFTDALGGTGTFAGTYTLQKFVRQSGQLAAVGTVTGTLTDSTGAVLGTDTQTVTTLVTAQATCQILHLELGPLDLNLLGLQVHLNRVVLDITAQSGPGNLLGNLLCAIANLLNGNQINAGLVQLLNLLLARL